MLVTLLFLQCTVLHFCVLIHYTNKCTSTIASYWDAIHHQPQLRDPSDPSSPRSSTPHNLVQLQDRSLPQYQGHGNIPPHYHSLQHYGQPQQPDQNLLPFQGNDSAGYQQANLLPHRQWPTQPQERCATQTQLTHTLPEYPTSLEVSFEEIKKWVTV